ncbi:hypothetical protein [Streptomyces sp. NPDC091416]|uniref:hypothetical protein n=1 Tax=Streptomyces sp. NPDC091416 TaxID=3366003 RepID=UPI00382E921B
MTDPHTSRRRSRRSIAFLLALGLPLTALTTLALPAATAAADSAPSNEPASEAKAFDIAAQTGERVEILDRREETVEVFANPDGTVTRRQYSTPMWSRYEGVWKKADATMVHRADGTIGPASSTFGIAFSGGGSAPLATMTKVDKQLSLSWPTALPEPVLDGNTALYKSVLPDVDLKVIAEVDGFAEHLIINTPQAAANPAVKSIKLNIATTGVTLTDDADDNLTATDVDGNVVFSAPRPKMWEQPASAGEEPLTGAARVAASADDGQPQTAPVGADLQGNTLTLTPDPTLLATADQFPLVVDPPFTGGHLKKWAVVYAATPGDAYPNGVGWHSGTPSDEPRVGFNGTGATRSFFAMDTDGLAGSDITDAKFALSETHSWGCNASLAGPTELWSTGGISNTPTWDSQKSGMWATKLDSKSYAHGNDDFCPGDKGVEYQSAALTAFVQEAADKGWSALTLGLRADSGYEGNTESFKRFSNSPALEVTYNFKPEVVAGTAKAYEGSWAPGGDGNKQVPCGGVIGRSSIALTARLRDKDSGKVTGEFSVTNSSGVAMSFPSSKVADGQYASVTVPYSKLANGSYTWKVRAKDDEGTTSAYTSSCAFKVDLNGPEGAVKVTDVEGNAVAGAFQARKTARLKLYHSANDIAGFCWNMVVELSASSNRCSNGTWVPVGADHHTAFIDIKPISWPTSTLHVVAYDIAGNHSPLGGDADSLTLSTKKSEFVYAPGKDPGSGLAHADLPGDLTGDGYADMVATDDLNKLRLYSGDGTGKVSSSQTVGTGGWGDALIAHHGDLVDVSSPTAAPDGYEDFVVRLDDNTFWVYGGTGLGTPNFTTRTPLIHRKMDPTDADDWRRVRQIILPGDIDKNETEGHADGNDLITIECTNDACSNAALWLYTGNTFGSPGNHWQNQHEPFSLNTRVNLGIEGWKDYTNLTIGDQVGDTDPDGDGIPEPDEVKGPDGIKDIVARDPGTGQLYLYPGKITNGVYSLGIRIPYGSGGWQYRPHLASQGNIQGTVTTGTYSDPDAGTPITYRQFQPKTDDELGDVWATTPADSNLAIDYIDGTGATKQTTCPSGCLLFYPGVRTSHQYPSHKYPTLVGLSGWDTVITGIF